MLPISSIAIMQRVAIIPQQFQYPMTLYSMHGKDFCAIYTAHFSEISQYSNALILAHGLMQCRQISQCAKLIECFANVKYMW